MSRYVILLLLQLIAAQQVQFVILITRHGARGPSKLYDFNAGRWTENEISQLTAEGMR